ncbi:dienelactone hydrolase family protein [Sphingobium chlorophenolicum]|uniref:Carboxymethylenebutenolidase n=1 Tax=Sphingobium chlorophenolicum TaxID=46429 RepID=A0A081RBK4_SPHCR|nr:dienelactone hydrolase family protein [Sphingobium chlorophenolicum]KEQ52577.1 Carboxymethylenebutenolidase [Sphingobium chlorophenolicum]
MAAFTSISTLEGDAQFDVYVARPEGTPKAAIVVIQEIFGVNEGIRRKCDDWAAKGYLAVAPDLFWREKPHVELDADVPEELQAAFGHMQKFNQDQGIRDIEATIKMARAELGDGGKVGLVGYCLGGRLAFMSACRTDGDAFVAYYGVGIDGLLNEQHAIGKPVLLHIPTADGFVPAEVQQKMHEGLKDNRHVVLHDYEGLDHGFAAEMGARRNEAAAQLADGRTADFFAAHL